MKRQLYQSRKVTSPLPAVGKIRPPLLTRPSLLVQSITSSSSSKRRSEGDSIHNDAGLSIEHLGTVTSSLQFESCQFPTASVSLCKSEIGFASIPVTALKDVLAHMFSINSQIQFLKVAWALLLSNYVWDSYVTFGFIDGQEFDNDFTKAIVCSFGACPSK